MFSRLVTVAAIAALIPSSRLIRRGDVRFRVGREVARIIPFQDALRQVIDRVARDLEEIDAPAPIVRPTFLAEDARLLSRLPSVGADAVVTSPPYLNGTNYFRNTKLELWFIRALETPKDLARFRSRTVTAGINDVSGERGLTHVSPRVAELVADLKESAYDVRIPRMVQAYFADMTAITRGLIHQVRRGASVTIDIGDSNYAGVNVPTDSILTEIFEGHGARLKHRVVLRERQARSGPPLRQVLLNFEVPQSSQAHVRARAQWTPGWTRFQATLPHRSGVRAKRNWGNRLHSLCSYGGKMKPSLAAALIETFVQPGGVVLDPFAGVGTIPFEAALQGRRGLGFEISPAAYHIARGKLARPNASDIEQRIDDLADYLSHTEISGREVEAAGAIRFNGPLGEYFDSRTFNEILAARRYFLQVADPTPADSFVIACILHVLHGNRPYALSRRSHPITPFAPTGPTEYRSLVKHLRAKAARALAADIPSGFVSGSMYFQDATSAWDPAIDRIDAVITSPPFFDSTRFYLANWMRLWFCGWEAGDFKERPRQFVDERQKGGFDVYAPILRQARERLTTDGVAVFHLGMSRKSDMASEIAKVAKPWFEDIDVFVEDVRHTESHGIRDKGTVTGHAYLVLR